MKKIIIVGVSGSGKTTTAMKLNQLLHIIPYDLDEYYWKPGWQPRARKEIASIVDSITEKESWIISGNFSTIE